MALAPPVSHAPTMSVTRPTMNKTVFMFENGKGSREGEREVSRGWYMAGEVECHPTLLKMQERKENA